MSSGAHVSRHPPIPVDVIRGSLVESRHVVYGCIVGDAGVETVWGDAGLVTFSRSALKPIQVLPLLVDGIARRLGLDDREIALATGSHSAQPFHLEVLASLMEKGGVEPSWLRCARHRPFHKDAARAVGEDYSSLHNNCSGKHAAMLAWCVATGNDVDSYLSPDHPLQRRILRDTARLSGIPAERIPVAVDGCGVPTLALPLDAMALMFRRLARPDTLQETQAVGGLTPGETDALVAALTFVRDAMRRHPELVAGDDRVDTDVIRSTQGRWVTKAGAEGLWCGADTATGESFAFKCIDGNFRAVTPAALEVLSARRRLTAEERKVLEPQRLPVVRNHAGTVVGQIVPRLP